MLLDGEEFWRGAAHDAEDAEDNCFDSWEDCPGSLERYTLQKWGTVNLTRSIKDRAWVTVYKDKCLAPF